MDIEYTEYAMPGLELSEKVYQLTSGTYTGTFIKVKQVRQSQDIDGDGIPDLVHIRTTSCVVDEFGVVKVLSDLPVITPEKSDAVMASAIAEGKLTIASKTAEFAHSSIIRAINLYVQYISFAEIPLEE